MAKGPRRPRRDRDQAVARGTPAGQRARAKGRDPKLPADTRGPSAKQVARDLAKLEERLAEARATQSKRQRQLEEAAAEVASLASDVARLHAALTAIEIAGAPDIASLVDGLDEEVARLDRADAVAPVRRRRPATPPQPVVDAEVPEEPVPEEPVVAEVAAVADVIVVAAVFEEEALLEIPEAAESEVSPGLPADVGELDALADVEQPEALVDVAKPEAVSDQAEVADEPEEPHEPDEPEEPEKPHEPESPAEEWQPAAAADDVAAAEPDAGAGDVAVAEPDAAAVDEEAVPAEEPEVLEVLAEEPKVLTEEPEVAEEEPAVVAEESPVSAEQPAEEPRWAEPAISPPPSATPDLPAVDDDWAAGGDLPFRPSLATVEEAVSAGPVAPSTNGSGFAPNPNMPDHTLDPTEEVRVAASIDVGSNSIHLLAAVVSDHELRPLIDESALLGLGSVVDERGYMSHRRADTLAAIRAYIAEARDLHAADVTIIGTEPMRRAADSTRLIVELENATGTPIHVVDHVEEALLTLIGVTGGRPVETDLGVVDVGGGSSEIVLISPGRPPVAGGLRVGSARLTTAIVRHDPPTEAEIAQLRAEARHRMASAPPGSPELLIAVGGTATNLLRVLPGTALDRILTRRRLAAAMDVLATEPAEEAARRHAVSLMRVRILPAGAAIMEALLERYGLDQLYVSDAGIREGTILAVAHSGPNWRDQLPLLAQGWSH